MKVTELLITPEIAGEWLQHNTHNRRLRKARVEVLVRAIQRGEWRENGATFCFAIDGSMLDGQHRAAAIAQAGLAVMGLVVEGLDPETQLTIDTGAPRKIGDVLNMDGERHYTTLGTALRAVYMYRKFGRPKIAGLGPTTTELTTLLEAEPHIRLAAQAFGGSNPLRRLRVPVPAGTVAYHIFHEIDEEDAEYFFDRLADPIQLAAGSPILATRRWFENQLSNGGGGRRSMLDAEMAFAILVKAWNAFRDGKEVAILRWKRGGAGAEEYPVPR